MAARNALPKADFPEPIGADSLIRGGAIRVRGDRVPLLSGEIQFFRMDPAGWAGALDNLKAAGIPIVSTYLSWRRFSTAEDRYDLEGRTDPKLDVRRFLDMCSSRGLWVTMKPGPWICAEEKNGGYPDWLVQERGLQALGADGEPLLGYSPPFQSPVPSYHHPAYLKHVEGWMSAVDAVLADYYYPRGPIILVQLDNEPCMTFHDRVFESDYNDHNVSLYRRWLEGKYGTVENLNGIYRGSWPGFEAIEPPRSLGLSRLEGLTPYFDWVEFKELSLASHVAKIRDMHLANGVGDVLFTINYNEHPQLAVPNDWHALESSSGMGGFDYYPKMPLTEAGLRDIALWVNYSRVCNRLPWSPEIMCGSWTFEGNEYKPGSLKPSDFEFLYLSCIAYGLKGMNFYMFADRDNWVESPLSSCGEATANCASVAQAVKLIAGEDEFEQLDRRQDVAVLFYRPYARESFIASSSPEPWVLAGHRLGRAYRRFKELFETLHDLNLDPAVVDPWVSTRGFREHRIIFVPGDTYMDESCLSALEDYIQAGGRVVWLGEEPRFDAQFQPLRRNYSSVERAERLVVEDSRSVCAADVSRFVEAAGIGPEVDAGGGVKTVLHTHGEKAWLFVVNCTETASRTTLRFRDAGFATMVPLTGGRDPLPIIDGRASIRCGPRSVMVWDLLRPRP